jgi:hypothetical protein
MGWTKRALVTEAFGELALAGYDFDLSPEELPVGAAPHGHDAGHLAG